MLYVYIFQMQNKAPGYVIAILQKDIVKVDNLKCTLPVTVQVLTVCYGVQNRLCGRCLCRPAGSLLAWALRSAAPACLPALPL